jgi:hypothetical protein
MAIKPFNSVGGFSVGEVPANVILANGDITTGNANLTANLYVTNTANVGNLRTNNLLYANGQPWDLQEAAGANTQIQYNLGNNFAASANFTYDDSIQILTVLGNANITKTLFGNVANFSGNLTSLNASLGNLATANFVNVASNLVVSGKSNLGPIGNVYITGGTSGQVISTDGTGNLNFVTIDTFQLQNGNSNVVVAANSNVTVAANGINVLTVSGFGGNASNNITNIAGQLGVTGNVTAPNFIGNVVGNISGNIVIPGANTGVVFNDAGNANSTLGFTFDKTSNAVTANGNLTVNNANLGNLATANFINVSSNVTASNLTVNLALSGNTANFTGNVTAANIIGTLANGNSNVKIYQNANVEVSIGGTANVATFSSAGLFVAGDVNSTTGNITSNGSVTANGVLNGANANVTGEAILGSVKTATITAPTGNITISAAGSNQSIYLIPTGTGTLDVALKRVTEVGEPTQPTDATTKQYVDNIAQGLSIHVPVRVTSATNLNATYNNGGTALTTTTISGGKTITFSANHGLTVGAEIYWTSSFNGIIANDAYFVYSTPALDQITVKAGFFGVEVTTLTNATGLTQPSLGNPGVGATLTNAGANAAISIDGVALSSTNRVLVQGQTNQFENGVYTVTTVGNGSTAWVFTRATTEDQYDPKSTTGLGYGDYFFVQEGITSAGSAYVLTSPTGEMLFGITNIGFSQFSAAGTYSAGNGIAITGTIISANVDLVTTDIVGGNITVKTSANLTTPNIGDATFSSLTWNNLSNGNVSANNLSIGNVANIGSNVTIGGSIQANANISSNANINGNNAFFTNLLNVGGNLIANNITSNNAFSTNTANISSNLVTSNATVNLALSGNTANFSGNVIVPNLTVNLQLTGNTANFSGNVTALNANLGNLATANYVNVSQQINGNTATFTGNIQVENIVNPTANTSIGMGNGSGIVAIYSAGNATQFAPSGAITLGGVSQIQGGTFAGSGITVAGTQTDIFQNRGGNVTVQVGTGGSIANTWTFAQDGSFTSPGNINALNANLGNLATANFFTGTLIKGTSNIAIPTANGNINLTAGGNTSLVVTATGANITGNLGVTGNFSVGSLQSDNLTANLNVFVGNTTISWGTVTTTAITANQTIATRSVTGVTGIEFLVKGIDSTGSKYSVATVTAVTDGSNVDFSTFGTVNLGGQTGVLAVNIVSGNVVLQVTPASSNSTVWTTQVRFI